MTSEEVRNQAVAHITELLQSNPFSLEFKVAKKPKGIRVIYEITQEEMDALVKQSPGKHKTIWQ